MTPELDYPYTVTVWNSAFSGDLPRVFCCRTLKEAEGVAEGSRTLAAHPERYVQVSPYVWQMLVSGGALFIIIGGVFNPQTQVFGLEGETS